MIETGEIKVVAKNYFRDPNLKLPEVWVHEYDEKIAQADGRQAGQGKAASGTTRRRSGPWRR